MTAESRLAEAARAAAHHLESIESHGPGNPWSEAIWDSLAAIEEAQQGHPLDRLVEAFVKLRMVPELNRDPNWYEVEAYYVREMRKWVGPRLAAAVPAEVGDAT